MTPRLTFCATVCLALAPGCGPTGDSAGDGSGDASAFAHDLLITGGTVVDGTGAPGRLADVLVEDGRIAFVGELDADTIDVAERFDATGLIIAPGFIDAHAHGSPVERPDFSNFLAMGVTTIVLGQDGGSPRVADFAAYLDSVDAVRPSVNVAYLVGHNTIRRESGVGFDDPDAEGLAAMAGLVEQGLSLGAFGLSTGLEYDPGSRSGAEELAAIAAPVAAVDGVITSHLRSEDEDKVVASLEELIEQGRRSGARVHATHLKIVLGNDPAGAAQLLTMMDEARAEGIEITADVYPYTASYTGIGLLFPDWAKEPNDYDAAVADRRPELAEHLRNRVNGRNGPGATLFGSGEWAGRTLAEVAAETGQPFEDVLIDLGPGGASAAYFVMNEGVMGELLAAPNVAVSSDGSPTMLHPRGHGSFPRVIRRYVNEESRLTLEEAVHKMTGLTARLYRLDDPARVDAPRGRVSEGWAADLVAFDPARVLDTAEFGNPHQLARGMDAVWIGGRRAWADGAPAAGGRQGRALRAVNPTY